jgi:hypothetical protein
VKWLGRKLSDVGDCEVARKETGGCRLGKVARKATG